MWHFAPRAMTKTSQRDPRKAVPAPAAYLRLLMRRFATTPEIKAQLLSGTDIDERRLMDPGGEVTLFSLISFSENLTRVVGETWPLDSVHAWATAAQGALDMAVRTAATIADAMEILKRYGHVRGPYLQIGLKRSARTTALTLSTNVAMNAATMRAMSETAVFSARSMLETLLGDAMDEIEYHFAWPKPGHAERLREALGGRIKYDQAQCALVLSNALCARTSPYADQGLLESALRDLESGAGRISSNDMLPLKVERLLKRRRSGRLSEDVAARELGISRRTLVRRLSDSGTSFRALLDTDLKGRAEQMLAAGKMSRREMAEALGFEDPTSFSRACRRWFKQA
jgi:AraC-like DNA-binding protein